MFLVWEVEITDDPGNETGFNDGTNIVLDDKGAKDIAESLAHELGHGMGLPDQYVIKRELMYGYDDVRGIHLRQDRRECHESGVGPWFFGRAMAEWWRFVRRARAAEPDAMDSALDRGRMPGSDGTRKRQGRSLRP